MKLDACYVECSGVTNVLRIREKTLYKYRGIVKTLRSEHKARLAIIVIIIIQGAW